MLLALKALAPKGSAEDAYDVNEERRIKQKMNALAQLGFIMGLDLPPRNLVNVCTIEAYDSDQCQLMLRLVGSALSLRDIKREGESLSYIADSASDGSEAKIFIANRDLDALSLQRYSPADGQVTSEWTRAADGTETFSENGAGNVFAYTENPDCSGFARAVRTDDGGHPWEMSWRWTSVLQPASFTLQFSDCRVNGLNERECVEGAI